MKYVCFKKVLSSTKVKKYFFMKCVLPAAIALIRSSDPCMLSVITLCYGLSDVGHLCYAYSESMHQTVG